MTRPAPPPSAQAGPFGGYLSKSTGKGINELFEQDLADDWTGGAEAAERIGPLLFSLTVYTAVRFAFLIVGITLPLPCGVFAPTLAIGAGVVASLILSDNQEDARARCRRAPAWNPHQG